MDKLDFVKEDKVLYAPPTEPELVEVPSMLYLMYDGQGPPEGNPVFQKAMSALYGVAYAIKFMPKHGDHPHHYQDFEIPPPEGLWWTRDGQAFDQNRSETWYWTLMLRMPEFVDEIIVDTAIIELVIQKNDDVYQQVRLERLEEGPSVQMMHIGPYAAEQASLARMDAFTTSGGYEYVGKHHEIYFTDPSETKSERLKTILRHPIALAGVQ